MCIHVYIHILQKAREETLSGKELTEMPLEELIGELGCSKIQGRRIINYLSEVVPAPENHAMTVTSPMHTALEMEAIQLEKDAKDEALSEVTVSMEKTEEGKGFEEICIDSVKVHIMSGVPLTLFFVCARVLSLSLLSFFSVFLFLSFLLSLSCIQTHTHTHACTHYTYIISSC